jgi:L-ascorbate metabolism protein UlaG (beta-lactamase superfamily)
MQVTKYTHACVRIESGDRVIVLDPGVWSADLPLYGVDAVLVTHEHTDHVDVRRLARLRVPIFAPVPLPGLDVTVVESGAVFDAAGYRVRAVGDRHATIADGQPDCPNLGYVVDDELYHPGDALRVPDVPVTTLLIPGQASWMKLGEAIAFARAVDPERCFAIHDGQVNDRGLSSINGWLGETTRGYRYLAPGESL